MILWLETQSRKGFQKKGIFEKKRRFFNCIFPTWHEVDIGLDSAFALPAPRLRFCEDSVNATYKRRGPRLFAEYSANGRPL